MLNSIMEVVEAPYSVNILAGDGGSSAAADGRGGRLREHPEHELQPPHETYGSKVNVRKRVDVDRTAR